MRLRAAIVLVCALAMSVRAVAQPSDDANLGDDIPTFVDPAPDAAPGDAADPQAGAADPIDAGVPAVDLIDGGVPAAIDPIDGGAPIIDAAPPVDALPSPDVDPLLFGQPEVAAVASPTEVRLGQPITLVVTAVYGNGVAVNLPDPLVLGDGFEAGRREVVEKLRSDGRRIKEWQIRVYPWEVGDLMVPPIQVTFTAGGKAAAVQTRPLPIRVVGLLGDVDDPKLLRDMTPPISLWSRDWFWALVIGGGVAIVVAIVLWLLARRRKKKIVPAPVVIGAPVAARPRRKLDALANATLAKLDLVEQSGRLDSERKAAYAEMIEIIRDYLGARFGIDHEELTSAELRRAIAARADDITDAAVAHWLAGCDRVRYGGQDGTSALAHATLADSRALVYTTTPGGRDAIDAPPAPPAEAAHA